MVGSKLGRHDDLVGSRVRQSHDRSSRVSAYSTFCTGMICSGCSLDKLVAHPRTFKYITTPLQEENKHICVIGTAGCGICNHECSLAVYLSSTLMNLPKEYTRVQHVIVSARLTMHEHTWPCYLWVHMPDYQLCMLHMTAIYHGVHPKFWWTVLQWSKAAYSVKLNLTQRYTYNITPTSTWLRCARPPLTKWWKTGALVNLNKGPNNWVIRSITIRTTMKSYTTIVLICIWGAKSEF